LGTRAAARFPMFRGHAATARTVPMRFPCKSGEIRCNRPSVSEMFKAVISDEDWTARRTTRRISASRRGLLLAMGSFGPGPASHNSSGLALRRCSLFCLACGDIERKLPPCRNFLLPLSELSVSAAFQSACAHLSRITTASRVPRSGLQWFRSQLLLMQ
jgi:hypothetical protein